MSQNLQTERAAWWREHIEAWKKSDLSQRAYCGANRLHPKSFSRWRRWFKEEAEIAERKLLQRHRRRSRPNLSTSLNTSLNTRTMGADQPLLGLPQRNRRRQFPDLLKRQIVEETLLPGATVSSVARLYGITAPCLFRWRKELGYGSAEERTEFAAVQIGQPDRAAESTESAALALPIPLPTLLPERPGGGMEIELADGKKLRFDHGTDPEAIRRVVDLLEGRSQ
jgi:transposase